MHLSLLPRLCAPALATVLTVGIGCYVPQTPVTTHQTAVIPEPPAPASAAAPVEQTEEPPSKIELVSQTVEEYIQRIDAVERRIRREVNDPAPETPAAISSEAEHGPASAPPAAQTNPQEPGPVEQDVPKAGQPGLAQSQPAAVATDAVELPARPAVEAVRVYPDPRPAAGRDQRLADSPPAQPNTPAVARDAPPSRAQIIEQLSRLRGDSSFAEQLDLRVLRLLAGDLDGAREPLQMVTSEQQALASRFIESLIALRQAHEGDLSSAASQILAELEGLEAALRPLAGLRIPAVAICQEVRGYGDYVPIEPPEFPAGQASEFVLYCELRDFVSRQEADGLYCARFELKTTILTRCGDVVLELRDKDVVDRCRNRRKDCFVPRLVRLPPTLAPGEYVAKVTVIDKLGEKLAEAQAGFRVVAAR